MIRHAKVLTVPDEADQTVVRPSDWNAEHTVSVDGLAGLSFFQDFAGSESAPYTATNAGAGSSALIAGIPASGSNVIGLRSLTTGTTATGRASITASSFAVRPGNGTLVFRQRASLEDLSTALEEFVLRIGIHDSIGSADVADGCYFEYNRTTSVNWLCCTAVGSVRTSTASNIVVDEDVSHTFEVRVNADGSEARFFVDGVESNVSPITTNIPVQGLTGWGIAINKTVGTAARMVHTDWLHMQVAPTVSRT